MSAQNRLAREKSPYLLQHARNPVDWYPWGPEAFEKARREEKPVFLSVGYSTCHWCHVMERESFEDEETARLLNEHFVPVKVDREERPDVDRVYMTFVQATTGSGGWPMSVWLTPERKPFAGGTYFPPRDAYGRPGFKTVLRKIAEIWRSEPERVREQGEQIAAMLRNYGSTPRSGASLPGPELLEEGFRQIARSLDPEEGGFGGAPKFPRPVLLDFLLMFYEGARALAAGQQAREMAFETLRKMAAGGIHDHLGGGFHRYSVDRFWHVPHFEKMLYDQAQLACAYVAAWRISGEALFEETARDILDYVRRDMTAPEGGFYSAEDADSLPPGGGTEKREGAFYVWSRAEIQEALGEDAQFFCEAYGVEENGNAPDGSDPHGEFRGLNILIRRSPESEAGRLRICREKLFELRAARPRPHLDDKIIAAWNGMMISAFARAARAWSDAGYLAAARSAAAFIRREMYPEGRLLRSFREGPGAVGGFADDYAAMIGGLLDLYEASGEIEWLQWAMELRQRQDQLFLDGESGGYFSTAAGESDLPARLKEDHDGAEPSPNSLAALNALRIARLLDGREAAKSAAETMRAFGEVLRASPVSMPAMLAVVALSQMPPRQVVIAGPPDLPATRTLAHEAQVRTGVETALLYADGGEGQAWLAGRVPFIATAAPIDGKPAAYVCENFTCRLPVTTPEELRTALG